MNLNLAQLAHLHLLLNHFPTIGTIVALGLFFVALIGKNDDLKRASLAIFFVIALLVLPVYLSGRAAQQAIGDLPGVSKALIVKHQDAALLAFVFMQLTGALSWVGLWQFRRHGRPAIWNLSAVLLISVVTMALMARAANIGGEIRHPEIGVGPEATEAGVAVDSNSEWLKASSISGFVVDIAWVWGVSETIHFIGLCLLFGIVLVINLRMLGMMKKVAFPALHRLLPWGILGFGINVITGMMFFITTPEQYTGNAAFQWKVLLMVLAGINILYFTLFDEAWAVGPGDDAPLTAKIMAACTIFLWFGVLSLGRLMPFIGSSF